MNDTRDGKYETAASARMSTDGSVISSRLPACRMVLTSASMPPTWHTITLLYWLLHVRLDRMPAAHVTMLMSSDVSSRTTACSRLSTPSCTDSTTRATAHDISILTHHQVQPHPYVQAEEKQRRGKWSSECRGTRQKWKERKTKKKGAGKENRKGDGIEGNEEKEGKEMKREEKQSGKRREGMERRASSRNKNCGELYSKLQLDW